MKYLIIICLLLLAVHPFSFARYNWEKENKIGAVGSALLALAMILFPAFLLLR